MARKDTLAADHLNRLKSRPFAERDNLVRMGEVGIGKAAAVVIDAGGQPAFCVGWISLNKVIAMHSRIPEGGEAGDKADKDQAAGLEQAARLGQGCLSISFLVQVVERAHQQGR